MIRFSLKYFHNNPIIVGMKYKISKKCNGSREFNESILQNDY